MRVLVACEYSGVVREAFKSRGHRAMSCDLLPAADGSADHYQGNVLDILDDGWDLMIAHPPCTHLAVSGARYFAAKRADGRQQAALEFVHKLFNANIHKIALENPVSIISSHFRKPDQIIQPFMFGHDASKATCLWLKNLPKLEPTLYVLPRWVDGKERWSNQTDSGQNKLGPSEDRWKLRSVTYSGIAEAMADQWSNE